MKKLLIIIALLILTTFIVGPVSANDASMGRNGETVYPMEETDARMVSEDIYIKYSMSEPGHVICEFIFENVGDAKSVLMGFPATMKIYNELFTTEEQVTLQNFTAALNGNPIEVFEVDSTDIEGDFSKYPKWYVFEVLFEEGQTLEMTHEYDINFTWYSTGDITVGYILETGSTWGGEISNSKVTFDLTDVYPWGIDMYRYSSLQDWTYADGLLIFEKSNYIPDFNLEVIINSYQIKNFPETMQPSEQIESLKEFFVIANDLPKEKLIEAYNNILTNDKFIAAVYMNTVLGYDEVSYTPISTEFSFNEPRTFRVAIKDMNFDMNKTAEFKIKYKNGYTLYEGDLGHNNEFGDYGNLIYKEVVFDDEVEQAIAKGWDYYYEVTISDSKGNKSLTTYTRGDFDNGKTTIISGNTGGGPEEIENPETSATADNFLLSLILFIIGTLLIYKKIQIIKN